ncbi:MAG: alpha/beta hydrolase [Clostridia bacterium]|nr:alpha/beta hydrolase [Clostridia bacterium]
MEKRYISVASSDGINTLNVKIYLPDGEPIGIFQAVHGMTEHLERYDALLTAVCSRGYFCIIHDHLGHGKTAKEGDLGFIAKKDGWKRLIDDVEAVYQTANALYPDKKHVLLGHSMGSFITRLYAEQYGNNLYTYIMMGSGAGNPAAAAGLFLTRLIAKIKGDRHISNFIHNMAFGGYNKGFKENSGRAWLSADTENIEIYSKDKYCTFRFTVSAMNDLIRLNKECNRKKWFSSLKEGLNIVIMSGSCDPVGEHSAGIKKVYNALIKQNRYNVTLKLYEGARHEILKDFCKEQVLKDILALL